MSRTKLAFRPLTPFVPFCLGLLFVVDLTLIIINFFYQVYKDDEYEVVMCTFFTKYVDDFEIEDDNIKLYSYIFGFITTISFLLFIVKLYIYN